MKGPRGEDPGPWGDEARHLDRQALERGLGSLPPPPRDRGTLALIVARGPEGRRETPERARLTPQGGLADDRWEQADGRFETQLAVMRADVAKLFANGQPLDLFGDNLLVDLDLSDQNLPAGSRLRVGGAQVEVTPEPHDGCVRFRQRFGAAALRLTAERRAQHLRGVYWRVTSPGEAAVGDPVEVLSRGSE